MDAWFTHHFSKIETVIHIMTRKQHTYIQSLGIIILIVALLRCIFPSIAGNHFASNISSSDSTMAEVQKDSLSDTLAESKEECNGETSDKFQESDLSETATSTSSPTPSSTVATTGGALDFSFTHKVLGVPHYRETFPDSNDVQMSMAKRYGVKPVANREEAEKRKQELVYAACDPYYDVEKLTRSIPYLVPRAQILLHDIGRTFFDSLAVKGIPLHKIIVTSVTRTQDDVKRLRRYNRNASENSCHQYGTTIDICYNRYNPVADPSHASAEPVSALTLKHVLSEVLRDMRVNERCYVKYEVKQGCFHITTR